MHSVSLSSSCSSLERRRLSKVKKDDSSLKTCHDREAREMAGQRMVRQTKIRMATASRELRRSEFARYVGHLSSTREVGRNLCRNGRSGNRVLWEYIEAFDKELGRPQLVLPKLWEMMQSKDTKNLNMDKDLDEILSRIKQTGWNESTRTKRFWTQDDEGQ